MHVAVKAHHRHWGSPVVSNANVLLDKQVKQLKCEEHLLTAAETSSLVVIIDVVVVSVVNGVVELRMLLLELHLFANDKMVCDENDENDENDSVETDEKASNMKGAIAIAIARRKMMRRRSGCENVVPFFDIFLLLSWCFVSRLLLLLLSLLSR